MVPTAVAMELGELLPAVADLSSLLGDLAVERLSTLQEHQCSVLPISDTLPRLLQIRELLLPAVAVPDSQRLVELLFEPNVRLRPCRLPFQPPEAGLDLADDVVDPLQVGLGLVEAPHGILTTCPVGRDAGGLFKEGQPFAWAQRQDLVDQPLTDDQIGVPAQSGPVQKVAQVHQTDTAAVEQVLTGAVAVGAALDRHLGEVDGKPTVAVVKRDGGTGHPGPRALGAPGEDHILARAASDRGQALLAEDPADGVGDVALAAAVGTDDRRDPRGVEEGRGVGERLEPLDLELLQLGHSASAASSNTRSKTRHWSGARLMNGSSSARMRCALVLMSWARTPV